MLRNTFKHGGQTARTRDGSTKRNIGHPARQLKSRPGRKGKHPANSTSQDKDTSEPEAKRIKLAGIAKSEIQPAPQAERPEPGPSRANYQSSVLPTPQIDQRGNRGPEGSNETSDLKVLGDSPTSQPHPRVLAPGASAHSSASLGLFEAVGSDRGNLADAVTPPEPTNFGTLHCLQDPEFSIPLRAAAHRCCTELIVGRDASCEITVSGNDVGKRHCMILLELWQPKQLPLRRRVRITRTDLERPVYRTSAWKGKNFHQLGESMILLNGDRVQFGDGQWFKYEAPKFPDLYNLNGQLHGDQQTNSRIIRVTRLSDELSFVAKAIGQKHTTMADRELGAFKILGYHPNITRFIEEFYDQTHSIHYLILEASQTDLLTYVSRMRQHSQNALADQAPQIIAQASSAIATAHRDIKPDNLLISVIESSNIKLSVCDFGLARLNTQVIKKKWLAGTRYWMAPGSFMTDLSDDRLVDCYGIGRVLYFM
ncbi:hypothetical protein M407DRAFT_6600 [Tulasnella calospora MUT 4182]|uniref:non-specific serine/threonine protein kinase n=1 Tax=Tulasnella calospora MUT 4182 TaxID=1051891 RepID=A0A0C3QCX0_9AGAM|nr:hypothetical protein M407DRAFT_6600 [Tulasnella calospora MUT 4182]